MQIGDYNVQHNVFLSAEPEEARLRGLLVDAVEVREKFIGKFLAQALRQAEATFRLSVIFMSVGGLIVLTAGILALAHSPNPGQFPVALVSGLGGALVGASGAAFAVRADKARKHLALQAERMHSEILDERRFTQVVALLSGIRDSELNDRARMSLALRILDDSRSRDSAHAEAGSSETSAASDE